jgi:hypothetical protein
VSPLPAFPTLQFRPFGLAVPDLSTRYLSSVDADMDYITGVWLAHADAGRYGNVGTFERQHFDEAHRPWANRAGTDPEVAYGGTLHLVELTSPSLRTQPDGYGRQMVDVAEALAADRSLWQPVEWMIDGTPREARLARFGEGWVGHTTTHDFYIVVVGIGIPTHVGLGVVADGSAFGVDFDRPLHGINSQMQPAPVDLNAFKPAAVPADFARLLRHR